MKSRWCWLVKWCSLFDKEVLTRWKEIYFDCLSPILFKYTLYILRPLISCANGVKKDTGHVLVFLYKQTETNKNEMVR